MESDVIYFSPDVPKLHAFKDLDPASIFTYMEFSYYVRYIEKNENEAFLDSLKTANKLIKIDDINNGQTFYNPLNLQAFYDYYEDGNLVAIKKRFSIDTDEQVHSLYGYLNEITRTQVDYEDVGGSFKQNVFARLMMKAISSTT